ncbi:unnamed protein product [Didymodactylos carnosus]|uniref:ADP ribosyltransferase domain-containing protein n=1 Tax=Didymodactylos carnosus TaxID=1234261 RepID=A0A815YHX6_9BILA|nr:unnamed protein product [Didymodactylos carnosus]CAF4435493.1 unnamed protein product [Didymodactylos carnosus]
MNKALRTQDINIIFKFRFFIKDLYQQLMKAHVEFIRSTPPNITVYRGQNISIDELNKIKNNVGGLIGMSTFLSTSTNKEVATQFHANTTRSNELVGVLFQVDVDTHATVSKPYADIKNLSYFHREDEILFSMGAIFRIQSFSEVDNGICNIFLELKDEENTELSNVLKTMIGETPTLQTLGGLMIAMGEFNKSEEYFQMLINQHPADNQTIAETFLGAGNVCVSKLKFDEGLGYFEKVLQICTDSLLPDPKCFAQAYQGIAIVNYAKGDAEAGNNYMKKSLEICSKLLPSTELGADSIFSSLQNVLNGQTDPAIVLQIIQKGLDIQLQTLSSNHYLIGLSYKAIGQLQQQLEEYSEAQENYEKAFEIYSKSLPPGHPLILEVSGYLATIHSLNGNDVLSQKYADLVMRNLPAVFEQIGPSNLSMLTKNMIDGLQNDDSDITQVYEYQLQTIEFLFKTFHADSPLLLQAATTNSVILQEFADDGAGEDDLLFAQKLLSIYRQYVPYGHRIILETLNQIGLIYFELDDKENALKHLREALEIGSKSLAPDDNLLINIQENIHHVESNAMNISSGEFIITVHFQLGFHTIHCVFQLTDNENMLCSTFPDK